MVLKFSFLPQRVKFYSIISYRSKNINAAGFHRRDGLIRKIAMIRIALFAFLTRSAAKGDDLIVIIQKQFSGDVNRQRRYETHIVTSEKNPVVEAVYHFLRFFP